MLVLEDVLDDLKLRKEFLAPIYFDFKSIYSKEVVINPEILEKAMNEAIFKGMPRLSEYEEAKRFFDIWLETVFTIGLNETNKFLEEEVFK